MRGGPAGHDGVDRESVDLGGDPGRIRGVADTDERPAGLCTDRVALDDLERQPPAALGHGLLEGVGRDGQLLGRGAGQGDGGKAGLGPAANRPIAPTRTAAQSRPTTPRRRSPTMPRPPPLRPGPPFDGWSWMDP
jgi:hypothetical protein